MSAPDRRPRWLRELERLAQTHSQLILTGNVRDQVLYRDGDADDEWTAGSLRDALFATFRRYRGGYEVVAAYNLLDGLVFADQDSGAAAMAQRFEELLKEAGAATAGPRSSRIPGPLASDEPIGQALAAIQACLANVRVSCVFIVEHAGQLAIGPTHLDQRERLAFLRLVQGSSESQLVARRGDSAWQAPLQNLLVLVGDRVNDLPAWLYLNNPFVATIELDLPRLSERRHLFERHLPPGGALDLDELVDLSEGLTIHDLFGLLSLARSEGQGTLSAKALVDRFKYGVAESEWDNLALERLEAAEQELSQRVIGQDAAVRSVCDVLRRARLHLSGAQHSSRGKPRGVLFFAGPTGVGKTELAKAVAQLVFNDEEACVRFDMSEFSQPHADQRLLGAPPGYVGYEEGGQLTNRLRSNPFRVLLFDEIEKAHPSILDKFLQILEDGRMTDGRGETVYFSESLIVFTSNAGVYQLDPQTGRPVIDPATGRPRLQVDPAVDTTYSAVRAKVLEGVQAYFKHVLGRPELLNRIGQNIVVFDYVRGPVLRRILEHKVLPQIATQVRERWGLEVAYEPAVVEALLAFLGQDPSAGGRGIGNLAEAALLNPLSRVLYTLLTKQGAAALVGQTLTVTGVHEEGDSGGGRYAIDCSCSNGA